MTKRLIILIASLVLVVPFVFYGCSGDDGAQGPAGKDGTNGINGLPGPAGPGALAKETCVVCHGVGTEFDVRKVHNIKTADRERATLGSVTAKIDNVTIGPVVSDNVPVSVTFTMVAKSANGTNITGNIDLRTASSGAATYLNFYIGKLVPAASGSPTWFGYILTPGASGSGPFSTSSLTNGGSITLVSTTLAGGQYTYTFPDNAVRVSGGYDNNLLTHRVGMQIYNLQAAPFWTPGSSQTLPAPFANATFDFVPAGGTPVTRDIVTTGACNQCHDPLGFHSGGARYDTKVCVICHASNIGSGQPGWDNAYFVKFVHGIHSGQNLGTAPGRNGPESLDFSEITYPQNVKNCDTCHKGTDGDNWKNRPSFVGCGTCHAVPHTPSALFNDANCSGCHPAANPSVPESVTTAHAENTATPNNVPAGLDNIAYFIDNVTVDNNFPVVTFRVTKNGQAIAFNKYTGPDNVVQKKAFVDNGLINGYVNRTPSFRVAFAANQDGINPVADYNNLGNNHDEGQPAAVSVAEIFLNDNNAGIILSGPDSVTGNYRVKLLKDVTRGSSGAITNTDSAAYPAGAYMRAVGLEGRLQQLVGGVAVTRTPISVVKGVTGDKTRRQVVDKNSCLECHKIIAFHGGSRVNEVQYCVVCHNPNLGVGGTQSLNFKDMIHAIHSATTSYPEFASRGWDNITYPGELSHCTKCHYANVPADSPLTPNSYKANLPAGVLLSTGSEIGKAPTDNDIVISPTVAACGRCHNASTSLDHFRLMGGDVGATRKEAAVVADPTVLGPDVTP